jgi:hypothetical protein
MNSMTRPGPISAICFIWTVATVFQLYQFSQISVELPAWSMFYVIGMAAATLTAIAGMWQMRKWGLMLFIGMFILNQAFALTQGQWHVNSLLLPALVIGVGMAHIKQFR